MRSLLLKCAAGMAFSSIGVGAFNPFDRESLELEPLRKRGSDSPDPSAVDIDPEFQCNSSCSPFLTALDSCDAAVSGIDYTGCLCKQSTFNDLTQTCYTCIESLGNATWTEELGFLLELCTATGVVNNTNFVSATGVPNGRGSGTNGGQQGGQLPNGRGTGTNGGAANLTISMTVSTTSGVASASASMTARMSTSSMAVTSTSAVVPASGGVRLSGAAGGSLGLTILILYLMN